MIGLDDALTAFEAAAFIGRNWARRDAPVADARSPDARTAPTTVMLSESEAKTLARSRTACACPRASSARPREAVSAAEKLGFPVTLKVSSAAIAHKTEAGGVALNFERRKRWRPPPSAWRSWRLTCWWSTW